MSNASGFVRPSGLARVFQDLSDAPKLHRRMGEAGREKASWEFTLDRMLRETERVYEGVLGKWGS